MKEWTGGYQRYKNIADRCYPLVLESISTLLEPHFTIVGMVQHSSELISRAIEFKPDVILMDARMPGLSGFAATREVKKLLPEVEVILVTMLREAIAISEAFQAGKRLRPQAVSL